MSEENEVDGVVKCRAAIDKAFNENTLITEKKGRVFVRCKKGLWAVDAPNKEQALREARHYFVQYYADGDYGI